MSNFTRPQKITLSFQKNFFFEKCIKTFRESSVKFSNLRYNLNVFYEFLNQKKSKMLKYFIEILTLDAYKKLLCIRSILFLIFTNKL